MIMSGYSRSRAVVQIKYMILQDVASGRVPTTVVDFGQLHDYVDANDYTALTAVPYGDTGDDVIDNAELSQVEEIVHQWLATGVLSRQEVSSAAMVRLEANWLQIEAARVEHLADEQLVMELHAVLYDEFAARV